MLQAPTLDQFLTLSPAGILGGRTITRQSSSSEQLPDQNGITITISAPQHPRILRGEFFSAKNVDMQYVTKTVTIPSAHGPALRAAIEELKNEIGGRLEAPHDFRKEAALSKAASAVGQLFAAVVRVIPFADPDYNFSN